MSKIKICLDAGHVGSKYNQSPVVKTYYESAMNWKLHLKLKAELEARGFEDGTSFWEALQKQRPELVVLDVMLPGIDGIELLRRMKSSPELDSIPVVMATAKGTEYDLSLIHISEPTRH